jgi:2-polyprenyl-3-methyl-5-hydroxy-6-metoxy-1,4-benzoquinol methylase
MSILPDLSQRCRQPEIMDQPDLDPSIHDRALTALARINFFSGSDRILWNEIRKMPPAPLRVLDVATGGGDIPIRLWQKAQRSGVPLTVAGCDRSTVAIDHARGLARAGGADVQFFPLDVLAEPLPDDYDVLTCSLFLHHQEEEAAVELLRRMGQTARRLVLVNDLARSRVGYSAAWLGTRLLSRSQVTHVDGPLSVQAAFTPQEALALARQAGWAEATVEARWPFRYLLRWAKGEGR